MNLEKICEETRVTPTNENYVVVSGDKFRWSREYVYPGRCQTS